VTLAVCVAWLGSFAWLFAGGGYTYFLAPAYGVLLVVGGVVLAAFTVGVAFGGRACAHGDATRAAWVPLAILVVPLAFLAANPRPVPGSYAFAARAGYSRLWKSIIALGVLDHARGGARPAQGSARLSPYPTSGPAATMPGPRQRVTPLDVALDYPGNVGQGIAMDGMVYRQEGLPAGSLVAFRFVITCCAADAWPAGILVTSEKARAFPIDSWVRVTGTVASTSVKAQDMPVVHAERIVPISPPGNPYIENRLRKGARR